jgi:hypothetical protein
MQNCSRSFRKPLERLNSNIATVLRSLIAHMSEAYSSSEIVHRSRAVDGSRPLGYSCEAVVHPEEP